MLAWQQGARFDAWTEAFKPSVWRTAFSQVGLDPGFYSARQRSYEEVLPWSHIDVGVSSSFLWEEYQRSLLGENSADCRERCLDCGVREAFKMRRCPLVLGGIGE